PGRGAPQRDGGAFVVVRRPRWLQGWPSPRRGLSFSRHTLHGRRTGEPFEEQQQVRLALVQGDVGITDGRSLAAVGADGLVEGARTPVMEPGPAAGHAPQWRRDKAIVVVTIVPNP